MFGRAANGGRAPRPVLDPALGALLDEACRFPSLVPRPGFLGLPEASAWGQQHRWLRKGEGCRLHLVELGRRRQVHQPSVTNCIRH
jgi:hypothetical protein